MTEPPIEQRANPPTRFLRVAGGDGPHGAVAEHDPGAAGRGRFPRPVSLGSRAVSWLESEVDEWIRERIAESRGDAGGGAP